MIKKNLIERVFFNSLVLVRERNVEEREPRVKLAYSEDMHNKSLYRTVDFYKEIVDYIRS